jgi:hypothetical protein
VGRGAGSAARGGSEPRSPRHRIDAIGSELGQTALVDVDRDGDLDWIAGQSNRTGGDVWWWEYRGRTTGRHLMGRAHPTWAPDDVDGDGWVDFLAGKRLLLSSGEPRTKPFLPTTWGRSTPTTPLSPTSTATEGWTRSPTPIRAALSGDRPIRGRRGPPT